MALALEDFKKSVGAAIIAGSLAFTPATAGANDDIDAQQHASNTTVEVANTQNTPKAAKAERAYSRKEAYRASTGGMILHYGENIRNADIAAKILNKDGYKTLAVPGGKPNTISVFINRSASVDYTQQELYDGTLMDDAQVFYRERIGEPHQKTSSITPVAYPN